MGHPILDLHQGRISIEIREVGHQRPGRVSTQFRSTTLPNGKMVFCLQVREVDLMYDEVREYFDNGIHIRENDTVFDVGANIGIFTLGIHERFGPGIRVMAFEPISPVFEILSKNVAHYQLARTEVFPIGLSKQGGHLPFSYFPRAPLISTAYPAGWKEELAAAMLCNTRQFPPILRWLSLLPDRLRAMLIGLMFRFLHPEIMVCPVRTVSDIVRERDIDRIDLLKIDVEKSELDVLHGIEECHWERIRQIVVEIHNVNERVKTVTGMLRDRGFSNITSGKGSVLTGSSIATLYATR